jgi:hypothetical protein
MRDIRAALALDGGSAQQRQLDLERRIEAIEKSIGISKGKIKSNSKIKTRPTTANTRMKIAMLTRQLSLARAAIRAMIKSEQDGVVSAVRLTARDIKLRCFPFPKIAHMRCFPAHLIPSFHLQASEAYCTFAAQFQNHYSLSCF